MRSIFFAPALAAAFLIFLSPADAKGRGGGILPGAKASDPVDIDAGKLDYYDNEQKLVYSGSVIVANGPSTLKVSKLTLFLDNNAKSAPPKTGEGGSGSDKVKRAEFDGPVTLVSPDETCTGDRGNYDRAENKVYLNGNVVCTQGDSANKGDRLVYDLSAGHATFRSEDGKQISGRVHSIITPKSK